MVTHLNIRVGVAVVLACGLLGTAAIGWPNVARAQQASSNEKPTDSGEKPTSSSGATSSRATETDRKPGQRVTSSERSEGASSPAALAAYGKAATYQNNRAYDLAVEAWESFLTEHGSDARAVEARYNLGVCYLEQNQLSAARAALEAALKSKRDFPRREDAYLNLGWTLYTMALNQQPALFAEAVNVFQQLVNKYPQGKYRDQALFLLGESYYVQGKRQQAAQSYEMVIQEYPESKELPNAMYALGVCFEELGKFDDADNMYATFIKQFPEHTLVPEVRMRRGEMLLERGQLKEAEAAFRTVAKQDDYAESDFAHYRHAYVVARQDRYQEAADLFAQLPEQFPNSDYVQDATIAAARAYYRAEQYQQAKRWFDRLLKVEGPLASEAVHWRSRLMLQDNEPAKALDLVESQLLLAEQEDHPFFVNLLMDQADAMYELAERKSETVTLYTEIADDYPEHVLAPQALYNAAFAAMELQQYRHAVELAERFQTRYPQHRLLPDVKHVKAESQLQMGDAQAAADSFGELVVGGSPDVGRSSVLKLRKAVALYAQQKYRLALKDLESGRRELPSQDAKAEASYLTGMCHLALDEYAAAVESFQRSLEIKADWAQADETLLHLSRALHKLQRNADAKATVERLLERFPNSGLLDQAYFRLGEYSYALGDYAEAARQYARVVNQWPDSKLAPYSLYGRGWSMLRQSDYEAAESSFSKLLAQFPDHRLADQTLYARAMARQQGGKFTESLSDAKAFLARDSEITRREASDALYVQALSWVGLKQPDKAIDVLQTILSDDPDYAAQDKVLYELAWAFKSSGQAKQATETFARLAEQFADSPLAAEASYHVGEAAYGEQRYAEAASAYRQARDRLSQQDSLGEKVLYKLGWAEYQRQKLEKAKRAFAEQLARFPKGTLAGDAYFMQAECAFQNEQYQQAVQLYSQASQRNLSSDQITMLTYLHAGQAAAQLEQWQVSYDWLASLAKKFPKSPYLMQVVYELAVAQQNLGNTAEAERLFGSVADRGQGALAARARFMLGELLYARRDYAPAIREFRKVMFGFDAKVDPKVTKWQAKAGFEAGQCAGLMASLQQDRQDRNDYVQLAQKFFQYVVSQHPTTEEAQAAAQQLEKYRS